MKTQHTPGPWRTAQVDGLIRIRDGDGDHVADSYFQADSRLIAAAPDLLAALELFDRAVLSNRTNLSREMQDAIAAARAALAKAKGTA